MSVRTGTYRLPTGRIAELGRTSESTPQRHLDARQIQRQLGPAPDLGDKQGLLQVITDLSGSMWGGNDATGLRHEATLVVAEHLATRSRQADWHFQMLSFDLDSPLDIGPVPLLRKTSRQLAHGLLGTQPGGISNLTSSLVSAEATSWGGLRALCILSDFQLFDMATSMPALEACKADAIGAIVFGSTPLAIKNPRSEIHRVDAERDDAEIVAFHMWSTIKSVSVR